MADVVGQRQRFGQILVERQDGGHRARDLRHFDGVRQTVAEMVAEARREIPVSWLPGGGRRAHARCGRGRAETRYGRDARIPGNAALCCVPPETGDGRSMACPAIGAAGRRKPGWRSGLPAGLGAQRIQQLPRFGRLGGRQHFASTMAAWSLETNTVGLSISDRSIFSPKIGLAFGEVELAERKLGQRRILLAGGIGDRAEALVGLAQLALVGGDATQIILRDVAFVRSGILGCQFAEYLDGFLILGVLGGEGERRSRRPCPTGASCTWMAFASASWRTVC
jgi:hypothetical protein